MSRKECCPCCGATLPGGKWGIACPKCLARVSLTPGLLRRHSSKPNSQNLQATPARKNPSLTAFPLRRFGDYELLEEIGRGGMAVVWRARQLSVHRTVAVKLLRAAEFGRPEDRQRFRTEAAAVALLQHPHVVALHDFGEHNGQPWFSMDFIEGQTLAQLVRDRPLSPNHAAELLKTVAEAVAYAHSRGILHRDIKPSNILLDQNGQPRITDFGLAKRFSGDPQLSTKDSQLTLSGQLLGTPNYAPPEQLAVRRGALGPHSDVYALGAVLYEALTGRPPFLAATIEATLLQVIDAEPPAPRLLNPAVPVDLETICLKCLEKEPERRYAAAQELADELSRFLNNEPIKARPLGRTERVWRWSRRNPALAAALTGLMMVFLVGFLATTWQWRRAERAGATTAHALIRMEIEKAQALFDANDTESALAHLAKVLRKDPRNRVAAERALSAMTYRSFPLPIAAPLNHNGPVHSAHFSFDGTRVITASADHTAQMWDVKTGLPIASALRHRGPVYCAEFERTGQRALTASEDGTAAI